MSYYSTPRRRYHIIKVYLRRILVNKIHHNDEVTTGRAGERENGENRKNSNIILRRQSSPCQYLTSGRRYNGI